MPPNMDPSYAEALRFLRTFLNFSKFHNREAFETVAEDIAAFRAMLRDMGDPHLQYSTIHVAGSKAKGSTCSFISSVLREAGFRTGLNTSPHLIDITESVTVDGVEISREEYGRLIALLRSKLPDGPEPVEKRLVRRLLQHAGLRKAPKIKRHAKNVLAYETGVALLHFANANADFGVVETGMGGRLDHSNVFDAPPRKPGATLVSVITTMALEHRMPLGETIAQIAAHKAGIIQPHGLTVLGPQKPEWCADVRAEVDRRCAAVAAPPPLDVEKMIHVVPGSEKFSPKGCEAEYKSEATQLDEWLSAVGAPAERKAGGMVDALARGVRLQSPLAGRHQAENLRTVLGCGVALEARGHAISAQDFSRGIAKTNWPARFEILSDDPLIIVDCCHEALSIEAFGRTYREFYGDRPAIAVTSFLRDNDIPAMCKAARDHLKLKHLVVCKADVPVRALEPEECIRLASPTLNVPMSPVRNPVDALRAAYNMRSSDEALLIYGDFYIAGAARQNIAKWLKSNSSDKKH